jgi:hypothetical protein
MGACANKKSEDKINKGGSKYASIPMSNKNDK